MTLKQRAAFYHHWSTLLLAGLSLIRSLAHLAESKTPPGPFAGAILARVEAGNTLAQSLRSLGPHHEVSALEIELLAASERIGRVPEAARRLAEVFEERVRLRAQVLSQLAYPAVVLHAAAVISPVPSLIQVGVGAYLRTVATTLASVYAFVGVLVLAYRFGRRTPAVVHAAEHVIAPVPVLGTIYRSVVQARFCRVLAELYSAGVGARTSLELAVQAAASPSMARRMAPVYARLESGDVTLAGALAESGALSLEAVAMAETGELAGKLGESLEHVARHSADEAGVKIRLLAKMVPVFIGIAVTVAIGVYVLMSFIGVFAILR